MAALTVGFDLSTLRFAVGIATDSKGTAGMGTVQLKLEKVLTQEWGWYWLRDCERDWD